MKVQGGFRIYKVMRTAVCFLIVLANLYSCRGIQTELSDYPWEEKKQQILAWATSERTKVDNGTLRESAYWIQFYQIAIALRPDLDDFRYFAVEMIKVSRIFEEGKITKEQFEDKQRQLIALLDQEEDRRAMRMPFRSRNYEALLFTCYRESLFLTYVSDLRMQLREAGPQLSSSHCAVFGDTIQCTDQEPYF